MIVNVAIFGAGGLGALVHDTLRQSEVLRPACYLDSDPAKHGRVIDGLPVRGGLSMLKQLARSGIPAAIVAIGANRERMRVADRVRASGLRLVSAIHPTACISPSATLGQHVFIGARAMVCVHATIADDAVISAGAIVEHDNRIGRAAFLHPAVRLAGGVTIDDLATVGIGSCVIPGRHVGCEGIVEPGAIVIRDVRPGECVGGAPARTRTQPGTKFVADAAPDYAPLRATQPA